MVDRALILRKLASLSEYLVQLNEYGDIAISAYEADWKIQRIVERTLQMMIETCLDITGHIISETNSRAPDSYADMFRILSELGILPADLLSSMEKMAKFRNIVVHQYEKVDPIIVIGILKNHRQDFQKFQHAITEYMKSS